MNSANLIKIDDINDKEKIKNIETAANKNQIDKNQVFKIYKQIPFDLNTLINAQNVYQSLEKLRVEHLFIKNFYYQIILKIKLDLLFY